MAYAVIDLCPALGHGATVDFIGPVMLLVSAMGTACLFIAALRLARIRPDSVSTRPVSPAHEAVTILKPLHGAEPRLLANLTSFVAQDYGSDIQLICGVQSATDAAIPVVKTLRTDHPEAHVVLVVDPASHGTNAKVSNLINMIAHARHPIIILSDSDMAATPDYLSRVSAALSVPGVAAVTCLYRGRGDAGRWSRLAAMGISHHFLPSVLLGTALGLATPCMGSTIALRRMTLDAIGGLAMFADLLADDYAIGAAVRARGGAVAVPDLIMTHGCAETSFGALIRQELRWNRTIARIDPLGFIGSIVLHPFPIALLALLPMGITPWPLVAAALALVARTAIAVLADRGTGNRSGPLLWIAARDLLSFVLFVWTFFGRTVDWRGTAFTVDPTGRLSTHQDKTR